MNNLVKTLLSIKKTHNNFIEHPELMLFIFNEKMKVFLLTNSKNKEVLNNEL